MTLTGRFKVRRLSGFLPPFGVTKRIDERRGCTYLFGLPFGWFRVVGRRLIYDAWPIIDELDPPRPDGTVTGRGRLFGLVTFCRFRLERK
jgi:hypothetical protein